MAIYTLSLCSGVGMLEWGIKLALPSVRTICYAEWEPFPAAVIQARIEDQALDDAPIFSNIADFDGRPWRGLVDIVSGSPPCQPVSLSGKQLGVDDPRFIWGDFDRIIGEVRPKYVFLENVANTLGASNGAFLGRILGDLAQRGFAVEWDIFSAIETSAPHVRRRWFLLARAMDESSGARTGSGSSEDCRPEWERTGTYESEALRQIYGTNGAGRPSTVGSAVADANPSRPQEQRQPVGAFAELSTAQFASETPDMVHAESAARLGEAQGAGGFSPQSGEESVAHASCQHDHRSGETGESRRGESTNGGFCTRDAESMGDSTSPRFETSEWEEYLSLEPAERRDRIYPPYRNDIDGWRELLGRLPEAQPAFRRDADGLAATLDPSLVEYRNPRLKAIGNGVVPVTVALAFSTLWYRLHGTYPWQSQT